MKRPLALIGLTAMIVLTVCFYGTFRIIAAVFLVALAGLIASLTVKALRKERSLAVVFASAMVAVLAFNMFTVLYVTPLTNRYSGEHIVKARVLEEPRFENNLCRYELRGDKISGEDVNFKLSLITSEYIPCKVGDTITFSTYLYESKKGNALSDKCYLSASLYDIEDVSVEKPLKRPLYYYAVELRDKIRTALYMELDFDNAALASAVLLGDKSGFSDDINNNIRRAGLSHIAVVSGLHLSIITMMYKKAMGSLIKNKYVNALSTLLIVLFFLTLTGFGKSAIRASIMLFIVLIAPFFKRESDSLNSLGLASVILCVANPYIVGDVGVLLSFSATFGIVAFSSPLNAFLTRRLLPLQDSWYVRINKLLRKLSAMFSVTFTAVVATLPVTILFFGKVSLVQIVSNMVVVPFVQYFMLACSAAALFHFVPYMGTVRVCLSFIANVLGDLILTLTGWLASIPMAYVKADYAFVLWWMLLSFILFVISYILQRKGKGLNIFCGILSLLILLSGAVSHQLASLNRLSVYAFPSEKGQTVILSGIDGNIVLCTSADTYGSKSVINVLDTVYNEGVFMLSLADNHNCRENAKEILSVFDYMEVLMYDKTSGDYTVELWDKATLRVFSRNGNVYQHLLFDSKDLLILPPVGNVEDIPQEMRNPDYLLTSGIIDNMELLSFETLLSNGNYFARTAVLDFFSQRSGEKLSLTDIINFDIVG